MIPGFPFLVGGLPAGTAGQLSFPVFNTDISTRPTLQTYASALALQNALIHDAINSNILTNSNALNPGALCNALIHGAVQVSTVNANPFSLYSNSNVFGLVTSAADNDNNNTDTAHTIVRAPVLYKNVTGSTATDSSKSSADQADQSSNETSPPDRIVASYAAAAHAAALVNHQPVSKAAEVFLSAPGVTKSRTKRARVNTVPSNRNSLFEAASTSSTTVIVNKSVTSVGGPTEADVKNDHRRAGWSRIVDRRAGKVVYISPGGTHLHNRDEVVSYFASTFPTFSDGKLYEELLNSCVIFEPTVENPRFSDELEFLSNLLETKPNVPMPIAVNATSASSVCRISFHNTNTNDQINETSTKRPRLSFTVDSHPSVSTSAAVIPDANPPSTTDCTSDDTKSNTPVRSSSVSEFSNTVANSSPVAATEFITNSNYSEQSTQNNVTNISSSRGITLPTDPCPFASEDPTIAKMTTETLTTGCLSSSGSCMAPSVVPEPMTTVPTSSTTMDQIINNSRLTQLHQQQQQLATILNMLASNQIHTPYASLPILSHPQPQINSLMFSTPTTSAWPQLVGVGGPSLTHSSANLQQQLLTAALLEQQQHHHQQAALATLLSQQSQNQQQNSYLQQQQQIQTYLAALQRQLPHRP